MCRSGAVPLPVLRRKQNGVPVLEVRSMACREVAAEVPRSLGTMLDVLAHLRALDERDVECHESPRTHKRRMGVVQAMAPFIAALGIRTVLDVGCAGITRQWWLEQGIAWRGLTFPRDAAKLKERGVEDVDIGDVAAMGYDNGQFDIIYASHVLEHSPMPLIALMECRRVARCLLLVVPAWPRMVAEPYHYSVMPAAAWKHLFAVAGWRIGADLSGRHDYLWLLVQNDADEAACKPILAARAAERRKRLLEKRARRQARRRRT